MNSNLGLAGYAEADCCASGLITVTVLSSSTLVLKRVKRSAFINTDIELSAIAAAAIIGFKKPKAANGIPRQL